MLIRCLKSIPAIRNFFNERDQLIEERNNLGELRYRFEHERDVARAECDRLRAERDQFMQEISRLRDDLLRVSGERDKLIEERNNLGELRYRFEHERDVARAECDSLRAELRRLEHERYARGASSHDALTSAELRGSAPSSPVASRDLPQILIFLHIAKTAGTTLGSVLNQQFRMEEIMTADPGASNSALGTWPMEPVAEKLAALSAEQKQKIRHIAGHFMFGIHRFLHGSSKYITMVRHPVERVISSYYYILTQPGIPVHQAIMDGGLTLDDYIRSGLGLDLHNYQTRILAGLPEYDCDWANTKTVLERPMPRSVLEHAKQNIEEHCALVGITEAFDEFVLILKLTYKWPLERLLYTRKNETGNRPKAEDIAAATIKLIEEHNQLDLELYEFIRARFDMEREKWHSQLTDLLPRFRLLNELHNLCGGAKERAEIDRAIFSLCDSIDRRTHLRQAVRARISLPRSCGV